MRHWKAVPAWIAAVALAVPGGARADWTSWRGPGQDGVSPETGLVSSWSPAGENVVWKAEIVGRSTPVAIGGRVCVQGRVGETVDRQEVVACYDAATGARRWEHRFPVYNTTVPFNRVGWPSPAADPETGNLYVHGVAGQLIAFDPQGTIVWSRFLTEEFGRLSGYGGRTQTPVIDGDQLLLSSVSSGWGKHAAPRNRYFAFDKRTGDVLWIATPGGMPADFNHQSVPVVAEIAGRRMVVAGDADGWIYALDVRTGEKLWGFQLSQRGINSTVLVVGDRVFAAHSEENVDDALMGRVVCIDGTGRGDVTKTHEVWRVNELGVGFPSPTRHDGRLYVVDNSANLVALDMATGKQLWQHSLGTVGKGSPVVADGKLYVPETNGRFHILAPGPEGVRALDEDELHVADGRYAELYGSPAVAYGRIYLATEGGLFCIGDKSKPFPAPAKHAAPAPARGEGAVAALLVVPAEVLMRAGEAVAFEVRGFDAQGRPLGARAATGWKLAGLAGSIEGGRFVPTGAGAQAGEIEITVDGKSAVARVRVVPDLPWSEDFEAYAAGKVPPTWIGAAGKFEVREVDGNKVLVKPFRDKGLLRNDVFLGASTLSGYTIEADVMGAQQGRRRTDIGLIASGYGLDLMGNHQRLQLASWPSENRVSAELPFPWEMGRWYRMKLRVDVEGGRGLVRGKVWPRGEEEPADWTIAVEDPYPVPAGSPGLTGYSPADILYDNLKVRVNSQ
jgi:outer membrane protein assembly factor BamB